jgi:kynureninase
MINSEGKKLFFVPEGQAYLLNHSVGCLPRNAAEHFNEKYLKPWSQSGSKGWSAWLSEITEFRNAVAELIHACPTDISPQVNLSSSLTKLLYSLPKRSGRKKIVVSTVDFPSIGFVLSQNSHSEYEVRWVPTDSQLRTPLSHWLQCLDETVQLVVISHSTYATSFLNPVPPICKAARSLGIYTAVDVAQSAGIVPIDIDQWQPDFVFGSCIKWLCGGPGAGFLWSNPALISNLKPIDVGWFSHEDPFAFDIQNFRYASDARRFWGGTPSIAPFTLARNSIRLLLQIGISKLQKHNQALCKKLAQAALEYQIPLLSPSDPHERGGTLCFKFSDLEKTEAYFHSQGVQVDSRPVSGIRVSPHIYNSIEDIDRTCTLFKNLAGG